MMTTVGRHQVPEMSPWKLLPAAFAFRSILAPVWAPEETACACAERPWKTRENKVEVLSGSGGRLE